MLHPLEFLPKNNRKPVFLVFLFLTILFFVIFRFLDTPLRTSAATGGIVSYELAGSVDASQAILDSWDANARLFAAFGLGFDYLFMPVYAFALSLGLLLAGNCKAGWFHNFTAWMGWGALAAVLFDALENYALWKMLAEGVAVPFPEVAMVCATIKFSLLVIGLFAALIGAFLRK